MQRIVLTGGPGAGKTVVCTHLVEKYPQSLVLVPEAATQVYSELGTRWDRLTVDARKAVQRRIYKLQLEQESRIAAGHPGKHLLLDRGTVDGAAYWPDGPEDYWKNLGTSLDVELKRYDMVIWMETCAAMGSYDGSESNLVRYEDAKTAIDRGKLILDVWTLHPNLKRVETFERVEEKISAVDAILRSSLSQAGNGPG